MCKICYEYQLGVLTWKEAWSNTLELSDEEHRDELLFKLLKETEKED